jgi:hypothetical protein
MIKTLPAIKNESVRRDFLRIFADLMLPEGDEETGRLINYCFSCLNSITRQVSIKVYSLEILYKITLKEPDLKNELALTIESVIPYNSMAFAARGRKLLKKLKINAGNANLDI